MLEWLYEWFVKIVSFVLSFFGISMSERSVEGGDVATSSESPAVEVPSIYAASSEASEPMAANAEAF